MARGARAAFCHETRGPDQPPPAVARAPGLRPLAVFCLWHVPRVVAAVRLRMRLRALLEEVDALVDVPRVPVDGRRRDAGEMVREEAAGSVVVAVDGIRRPEGR